MARKLSSGREGQGTPLRVPGKAGLREAELGKQFRCPLLLGLENVNLPERGFPPAACHPQNWDLPAL